MEPSDTLPENAAHERNSDDDEAVSSSSNSSSSTVSSVSPNLDHKKRSREEKKKAEMLQLALQAITTFNESRKRSSSKRKRDARTTEDSKQEGGPEAIPFIHPLLRQIRAHVRVDYSNLPLPLPVSQPDIGPQLDYFEEGSSSGSEYDPDTLVGEGLFRCQLCCEVFPTQESADQHMTTPVHRDALDLMTSTIHNYCNDIDAIVKLRDKIKARREQEGGKRHFPLGGRTESESEDEKELDRLETGYAAGGASTRLDPVIPVASLTGKVEQEVQPAPATKTKRRRWKKRKATADA